jgi:mannose-6-phosphate isomerase-like protein (cupin superfamily)
MFQTKELPNNFDYLAPDCSEIRKLAEIAGGGLAHCTLPVNVVSRAVFHLTVEELWYFIAGKGQVWRKSNDGEEVTDVHPGISLAIPLGTSFQFRNTGDGPLVFLIATMPPWPEERQEAVPTQGYWETPAAPCG